MTTWKTMCSENLQLLLPPWRTFRRVSMAVIQLSRNYINRYKNRRRVTTSAVWINSNTTYYNTQSTVQVKWLFTNPGKNSKLSYLKSCVWPIDSVELVFLVLFRILFPFGTFNSYRKDCSLLSISDLAAKKEQPSMDKLHRAQLLLLSVCVCFFFLNIMMSYT